MRIIIESFTDAYVVMAMILGASIYAIGIGIDTAGKWIAAGGMALIDYAMSIDW